MDWTGQHWILVPSPAGTGPNYEGLCNRQREGEALPSPGLKGGLGAKRCFGHMSFICAMLHVARMLNFIILAFEPLVDVNS